MVAFSLSKLASPLVTFGVSIWIDQNPPPFHLALVGSDAVGAAEVPIPIPPSALLAGQSAFAQFFWPDPCAASGISASNAPAIVVQP
ncbi:MAG: hypothetical protein L0323_10070 [Planctomycetes bacterium]|nr:hypothetical protein [Planctomycetota bacterium]